MFSAVGGSVVFPILIHFNMSFPSDQRRYSIGASLTGSPPKHPTILPPAAVRASARVSLCTTPQNKFRIVAESADGAFFCVDEMSSAPSAPSPIDGDAKLPRIDTSYADEVDMDDWARTPLPDRRKLHHSLWPETPGRTPRTPDISPPPSRPPPGPPPTIPLPLPPRPLPRRPLPSQPQSRRDSYKTHSRSFSDSISSSSSARALPPPPLDLSGAKALQAMQKQQQQQHRQRVVEADRVEHIVHQQTQEKLERSERVERHYQHLRGASLSSIPRHPFAVPSASYAQNNQSARSTSSQTTQSTQSQVSEIKRSGSRLQRVGRIPAQATPTTTPEATVPPRVLPAPTPATAVTAATVETEPEEEEEIHFGTTVQRAQSVSRAHPAILVDLAGFASDDSHASHRYAYHDPEGLRLSHGSFGPRTKVNSKASGSATSFSPLSHRTTPRSSPSELDVSGSNGNTAPLTVRSPEKAEAYVPPHRRAGAITPSHAPTQSQLLRAIEAQINDSRPVEFTPAPSPISRRTTRVRGPLVPLRPGVPSTHPLPPDVPPSPKVKGMYPAPIAEAMLALIGRRNHVVHMQEVELRKQSADDSSVVELGDAAGDSELAERQWKEREKKWKEAERKEKEKERREAERKEKYTFKPPRGLLPSVVPAPSGPPQRPPRSPLRLSINAPPRPPRSDLRPEHRPELRPMVPSPQTPGVMHDIALTPVAVDFSQPRPYSLSSPRPKKTRSWYAPLKRLSNRGDWAGAKPVKLGSRVDLYEPSDKSSKGSKVTLEIPQGSTTALPPKSPGLTPRTPHTPRLAAAEAGFLPSLARRRASKPPTDDKKRKKRLMLGLGVAVLIVIVVLTSVLIAKNKQRGGQPASESEEGERKQQEEQEAQKVRDKGLECARSWVKGDNASFDCYVCYDPLSQLPNDYVNATAGVIGVGEALQYCTLMNIWDRVEDDKHLKKWGETQSPCRWTGIGCDRLGRVTALELRGSSVPESMPDLRHLVSLQSIRLDGNSSAPSGTLDLSELANLTLVNAEWTLLEKLKVGNASSVVLIHNEKLALPDLSNTTVSTL